MSAPIKSACPTCSPIEFEPGHPPVHPSYCGSHFPDTAGVEDAKSTAQAIMVQQEGDSQTGNAAFCELIHRPVKKRKKKA